MVVDEISEVSSSSSAGSSSLQSAPQTAALVGGVRAPPAIVAASALHASRSTALSCAMLTKEDSKTDEVDFFLTDSS